ncbi:hypothetical protein [Phycicoccus sonneratiae]|uniref:Uncharacterized protein n=1 Tax=Phycicoccus sonneratiae TaxID=2807628 RepID=A0ABS2CK95_9MICO|nr:hypothetical protein [Phycicoccus sonneraticus]MBM6400306.1 hypothetical protein [Phycicoccus sonneraticus]
MNRSRGALLGLVLGWLAVVAVVGGLTFAVVSRAGSEVGQASALRTVATGPRASSTAPAPSASPSEPDDDPSPTGTPTSDDPAPSRTGRPTSPSDPSTPSGGGTSRPTTPTTTAPATTTRTRSFTTEGGTVVASCTGSRIGIESITVRDGWRFEDERESRKVEIHFSRSGSEREDEAVTRGTTEGATAEDEGEVEIVLVCSGGVPTRGDD